MGAINIQNALKQMDGVFGCKVSVDFDNDAMPVFTFSKKNIIEYFCDLFSADVAKYEQRSYVMHALNEVENEIKESDNGAFKLLIEKYNNNNDLIDFKEIRRTLRSSITMQFPPVIYARPANGSANGQLLVKKPGTERPHAGLNTLADQKLTADSNGMNVREPVYQGKKAGDSDSNLFRFDENNLNIEDSFSHAKVQKIDKWLAYGDASSPDNKRNLSRLKMLDGGRLPDFRSKDGLMYVQDWVDIYQSRLTNETFVIDDTARVYCEHDASITESNLQAFCYALLTLDNNDELPKSIFGGSESNDAWIYSMLCKSNPECAEKVKSRMQHFSEAPN
jgi:hypothetical protein